MKPYTEEKLLRECQVTGSVGYDGTQTVATRSNIERELAYCIAQALHHYGIIRLICHECGIAVPAEFGAAPATQRPKLGDS